MSPETAAAFRVVKDIYHGSEAIALARLLQVSPSLLPNQEFTLSWLRKRLHFASAYHVGGRLLDEAVAVRRYLMEGGYGV